MMGSAHWIEFYEKFSAFADMARRCHFYDEQVQEMEYSLFEMCPLPKRWVANKNNKKVGNSDDTCSNA